MKFQNYHPAINLIYFIAVIVFTSIFNSPIFVFLSFGCSLIYLIKLNGKKAMIFGALLFIGAIIYGFIFAFNNHFGVTILNFGRGDNKITLEALTYGLSLGIRIIANIQWLGCVLKIFSTDKVGYLLGCIFPKLSLFLAIILQTLPRFKIEHKKMIEARRGLKLSNRAKSFISLESIGKKNSISIRLNMKIYSQLISRTIDDLFKTSDSMNSRGYCLKGKSHFSIYRFDYRDRIVTMMIFLMITIIYCGYALEQTCILYNPRIVWNNPTGFTLICEILYGVLCILPIILEVKNQITFRKLVTENTNRQKYTDNL